MAEQDTLQLSRCSKILISGLPLHVAYDDIEDLLSQHGSVERCENLNSRDSNTQSMCVTYETSEQAQLAVNSLNEYELEGSRLKVELIESSVLGERGRPCGDRGVDGSSRSTDFPLRLLVNRNLIGMIIGHNGRTIRYISQECRTRINIDPKDSVGSLAKIITIYGKPENCTDACKWILEIIQHDAYNTNRGKISLKILASNNLIGSIIGKGGTTIKKITQETNTNIVVSPIDDVNIFNSEQIITINGSIENIARAESQISAKLRQTYLNDLKVTTYLYIANNAVGAVVGTNGLNIQHIIRLSNASVVIAPLEQDTENQAGATEGRKVTIIGSPEAQWRAQYLIVEKMREKGLMFENDDVLLTVEIVVTSSQVERIVGEDGQGVRELERATGALISLLELPGQPGEQSDQQTSVRIVGPFHSAQSAQRRIRALMPQVKARSRHRRAQQSSAVQQKAVTPPNPPAAL